MPDPALEPKVKAGMKRLRAAKLMHVTSLAGTDLIQAAYEEAVREEYRFFSYGDCMLIL